MDLTYLTDRLAVGGGIWTCERMALLAAMGITHIVNLQVEFDDRALAQQQGLFALWNPAVDDLEPKPEEFFARTVDYALEALQSPGTRVYVHCAAGVHRAPIAAAAVLCALGYRLEAALTLISVRRPVADFPEVYVESLRHYLRRRSLRTPYPQT